MPEPRDAPSVVAVVRTSEGSTVRLRRPARRPPRGPRPNVLPPARAVAGALVAVAGVALGIGTLLWATGDPPPAGPASRPPSAVAAEQLLGGGAAEPSLDEPAVDDPGSLGGATGDESTPPPAVEAPAAPAPEPTAPPLEVPVLVLNNSRIPGLAASAARVLESGGWPVRETGNLRGRIRASTVYYEPGQEAAAHELARRFPGVRRVLPRLPDLPGSGLTVVVTRDFSA